MSSFQTAPAFSFRFIRRSLPVVILIAAILLAGCAQTGQMEDQPRYDPLSASSFFANGQSARAPVPNSVTYAGDTPVSVPVQTGKDPNGNFYKGFPVPITLDLVKQGQERYSIYCVPCHGASGKGDGKVVTFGFSKPPTLLSDDIKTMDNGELFQVIQNGKGKMFPYGYRVKPLERWAIILYVRALELKNGPVNPADLTPDLVNQLGKQQGNQP
jgi:mono/diheme cytochrome c family protein